MSIEVRFGRPEDDEFIATLGAECAGDSISRLRPADSHITASSFQRLLAFCRSRPGTVDIIAERDGKPVGFLIMLTDIPDEVTQGDQAFVAYMAVDPKSRGRGAGRALIDAAEAEAVRQGLPHVSLMVTADNDVARRLYASAGFFEERMLLTKPISTSGDP